MMKPMRQPYWSLLESFLPLSCPLIPSIFRLWRHGIRPDLTHRILRPLADGFTAAHVMRVFVVMFVAGIKSDDGFEMRRLLLRHPRGGEDPITPSPQTHLALTQILC